MNSPSKGKKKKDLPSAPSSPSATANTTNTDQVSTPNESTTPATASPSTKNNNRWTFNGFGKPTGPRDMKPSRNSVNGAGSSSKPSTPVSESPKPVAKDDPANIEVGSSKLLDDVKSEGSIAATHSPISAFAHTNSNNAETTPAPVAKDFSAPLPTNGVDPTKRWTTGAVPVRQPVGLRRDLRKSSADMLAPPASKPVGPRRLSSSLVGGVPVTTSIPSGPEMAVANSSRESLPSLSSSSSWQSSRRSSMDASNLLESGHGSTDDLLRLSTSSSSASLNMPVHGMALPVDQPVVMNGANAEPVPKRRKSITRKRRHHGDQRHEDPNAVSVVGNPLVRKEPVPEGKWWPTTAGILTCCIPTSAIKKCGGMHEAQVIQAWREKVALCIIILMLWALLGFVTFGFVITVCPPSAQINALFDDASLSTLKPMPNHNYVRIRGFVYDIAEYLKEHKAGGSTNAELAEKGMGKDLSKNFPPRADTCLAIARGEFSVNCQTDGFTQAYCHEFDRVEPVISRYRISPVSFGWEAVANNPSRMVYNGFVLDVSPYLAANNPFLGPEVDALIRSNVGKDASKKFAQSPEMQLAGTCLYELYTVGTIEKKTIGCFAADVLLYISFGVIISVVMIRFVLAFIFYWTISKKLGSLKSKRKRKQHDFQDEQLHTSTQNSPTSSNRASVAESSSSSVAISLSATPDFSKMATPRRHSVENLKELNRLSTGTFINGASSNSALAPSELSKRLKDASLETEELYTVIMVPCYSEGLEAMTITLDSLADTDFSDDRKMICVVADGLITGSGNSKSTPQIVVDLMQLDPNLPNPAPPMSYIAVADGSKRHNMAQVYVGHYVYKNHRVPTIAVIKCGTPEEKNSPKPGNRGKRDSQIIMMSFFQKVIFDERMTPLEYDLFTKVRYLMGINPDDFEICLMVDADTKVAPDSLARMVACMARDPKVVGLCGETRISNKSQSWVTRIQVFEYYINHHLTKAFESIFGGVTCLPGCFCMYRIKTPREDGFWVPILASPDIVQPYSEFIVETLHRKNLLLLGEDRYLTTLMLRTFPKRKMIFVPKAYCKTCVPDTLKILLSQRRRWINSTIHNLLELVLVRELCGTFCCSMQFVIFLELFGTAVLPAAITFTFLLVLFTFIGPEVPVLPLILLAGILGLPALLIGITSRKLIYVYWMFIYLLSLPIWNFLLPTYAFWHFDDFSWGQTRKVAGEDKKDDHGKSDGIKNAEEQIPQKRWVDWEKDRRRRIMADMEVRSGKRNSFVGGSDSGSTTMN